MDEVDQCVEGSAHGPVSVYTYIDALLQGYCPKLNFIYQHNCTVFDTVRLILIARIH